MRRALLLDTETQGLDARTHATIEVAVIVYDIPRRMPLMSFASLLFADRNPAEATNGIPASLLQEAPLAELVWNRIYEMAKRCDVIVAHRAEFDRNFVPAEIRNVRPWVCSKFDLGPWPCCAKIGESLVPLALAHGVGVVQAHRALTDCDILARLLTRASELGMDLSQAFARALRPKSLFYAATSFDQNELVKVHGFAWDPDRYGKNWYRWMPAEDAERLPFRVRSVQPVAGMQGHG